MSNFVGSGATYRITIADWQGNALGDVTQTSLIRMQYTRVINGISTLVFTVPTSYPYKDYFVIDNRVGVYRKTAQAGYYLDTDTIYFIRRIRVNRDTVTVTAYSPIYLLDGRIIAYDAGSAKADYSGAADDVMKQVVRDNLGSGATDTSRDISSYLTVTANTAQAGNATRSVARRNVLRVIEENYEVMKFNSTPLYFDIASTDMNNMTFSTYLNYRGSDRTLSGGELSVVFSEEAGNLQGIELDIDFTNEVNYAYAGSEGIEDERLTGTAQDSTRSDFTPLSRREIFINAISSETQAGVDDAAENAVAAGQPLVIMRGQLVESEGLRYGVDWFFGDKVTIDSTTFSLTLDVLINQVSVTVENNSEIITAQFVTEVNTSGWWNGA